MAINSCPFDRLSIIWQSDLTDKMKCNFFQAAVVSILPYGCTTWTLTKGLDKKLDGNYPIKPKKSNVFLHTTVISD